MTILTCIDLSTQNFFFENLQSGFSSYSFGKIDCLTIDFRLGTREQDTTIGSHDRYKNRDVSIRANIESFWKSRIETIFCTVF